MRRHSVLTSRIIGLAPLPILVAFACAPGDDAVLARAHEIHERVLTIDTHDDIPSDFATPEVDPGIRGERQVDLPKMREGGLDAGFFIVYVGQTARTPEN
jgi:membrane dipeptidase